MDTALFHYCGHDHIADMLKVGGTYFPPTAKHGRPGFDAILQNVDRVLRR
jgi:hypothetical protein